MYSLTQRFPEQTGALKVAPVYNKVPALASLYHLKVPEPPEAVTVTVPPKLILTAEAVTVGALGDGVIVIFSIPVTVKPFLVTEIVPVVPGPANPVIIVSLTTVKDNTAVPPIFTEVTPEKLVPVIEKAPELAQRVVGITPAIVGEPVHQA
jgi:hypothetical protein